MFGVVLWYLIIRLCFKIDSGNWIEKTVTMLMFIFILKGIYSIYSLSLYTFNIENTLLYMNAPEDNSANNSNNTGNEGGLLSNMTRVGADIAYISSAAVAAGALGGRRILGRVAVSVGVFGTLGGLYTLNTAINNPEGVRRVMDAVHEIRGVSARDMNEETYRRIYRRAVENSSTNRPGGNGSSSLLDFQTESLTNNESLVNNSKVDKLDWFLEHVDLLDQYNLIIVSILILSITSLVLVGYFCWSGFLFLMREKIISHVKNKYLLMYINFNYIYLRVVIALLGIILILDLSAISYGSYFLFSHPLPSLPSLPIKP